MARNASVFGYEELSLSDSLRDALCGARSPLGDILRKAIAYETADWNALGDLGVDEEIRLSAAYADAALAWSPVFDEYASLPSP